MKIRDDGELRALIARATDRAPTEDAQLRGFLELLRTDFAFPLEGRIVGEPVVLQSVRYDGNPRRGLVAQVLRNERAYDVALVDVSIDNTTAAGRALAAFRAWVGASGTPPDAPAESPALLLSDWEDDRSGDVLEMVVLAARQEAARVRLPATGEEIILRSTLASEMIPGETLTVLPRKRGTWRQLRILSGEVRSRRFDVSTLGLQPLRLHDRGLWDPLEEYRGEAGRPMLPHYVPIVQAGPRPAFEMEAPETTRRADDDPILRAIHLREEGDEDKAWHLLMDTVSHDLRTLDAHAWLGTFRFRDDPRRALAHWRVGFAIGELSVSPRFAGVLPWTWPDNRPFLRCLFGVALALWRLGQSEPAVRLLERLLWLNPGDQQGARHILGRVREGRTWNGDRSEVA